MARQQLTEAVGIAQPLNRIAGALGRPGDDLRVERLLRVPPLPTCDEPYHGIMGRLNPVQVPSISHRAVSDFFPDRRLLECPVLAAPRRTEPPGERSGEPTSPTATLSYYPLPPGTSAASLAAAAGDRMSYEWHLRGGPRTHGPLGADLRVAPC
jgi:hypothetical protein